jgi:site-specific recombinase XerD
MVIRSFLGNIRDTGNLDSATVQRYLITLRVFWKWAIEEGFFKSHPAANIKVNGIKQKVIRGLSPDQVRLLVHSLNDRTLYDARNKAIVLMLVDCGLRVSEITNLRVDDIDSNMGILTINGKGSKQRLACMGLKTQKTLWKYLTLRNSPKAWLWVNRRGDRLTSNGIEQMIRKLGIRLGMPLYPQLLRHTFAVSWEHPRRVVAKVEWHQGQLFPRVSFVVTNLHVNPKGVVHFYNRRGTAEQ